MVVAARLGLIQALNVDPREPRPDGRHRLPKRGRAFDRTYLNGQATDHAAVLALFQTEAQSGTDPDVKAFAARVAPDIQAHLTMAEKLGGHVAS